MNEITHSAIVTHIDGNTVSVKILDKQSCAGCSLQNVCGPASTGKTADITTDKANSHAIGQQVELSISSRQMGMLAFWGYIAPLILSLTALLVTLLFSKDETLSAIVALAVEPPYYLLLWLGRKRLKKAWQIKIR